MGEIKKTFLSVDGNTAAALGSYCFTEVAAIYPITPSSPMADYVDHYAAQGKKNYFGSTVKVCEMQSEGGASGALHGAIQAGTYGTTFTASQGLLLMVPNVYKWVGEEIPAVMEVSARALASRSLCIFGDHQDIYAVRQTGIAMVCSHSVQEVADLTPIAHLIAMDASYPVCHFFDGFRTSHEIQNVEFVDDEEYRKILPVEKIAEFRKKALNPHGNPVTRGGAENDDIYFTGLEAQNKSVTRVLESAKKYFKEATRLTGREYAPFVYVGAKDATKVIVAMGSVTETALEVINDLQSKGEKVGLLKVILYRPFSAADFVNAIPSTAKVIAVLDRTKEKGAIGEPLYEDVVAALKLQGKSDLTVIGGRYGLGSHDTQPKHIKALYDWMDTKEAHHDFTLGVEDDVTNLNVPVKDEHYEVKSTCQSCLFYGLGSDGTVGANKSSIKIIGDATHQYAQAYFAYDSRKSGGVTRSHLRFGKEPIHSTYYIQHADFISVSLDTYMFRFDILKDIKEGGTFLLNTDMDDATIEKLLPNRVKYQLATKNVKFYAIDANKIALEIGMGRHTNTILQSAFFYLNQQIMPYEEANAWMKKYAEKTYAKKGEEVVKLNWKAIDSGTQGLRQVAIKEEWKNLDFKRVRTETGDDYFDKYVMPINTLDGYDLPVSMFTKYDLEDGTMQPNVTYKEGRSIADKVPMWNKQFCIECNQCAFVCPHATIRPFLVTDEEIAKGPEGLADLAKPAVGSPKAQEYKYILQVSPTNCVGCGVCVTECLANQTANKLGNKNFALQMVEAKSQFDNEKYAEYLYKHVTYKDNIFPTNTVKGVGFMMPYQEISGSCQGCGETPYYRLLSQLFGKDLLIANATGCSSIYNGSTPMTPFVKDKDGNGIAWANSLFEDNAEYGYGMRLATDYKLGQILGIIEKALAGDIENEVKEILTKYVDNIKNKDVVREMMPELLGAIVGSKNADVKELLNFKNDLLDKSVWIIGGDGFAYDIGYGGLDHVLASEDDINILVLDNEQYANTGGQASKATQTGAIAQFAASGKKAKKKNLALIAMAYSDVYVAQIALGSNPMKAIQAFKEAESYKGPSIIIAYVPCINQGIKGGLVNSIEQEKKAVECGFFTTWRFDPRLVAEGKPGLTLDCKEPDFTKFKEFLLTETRFSMLPKVNPAEYEKLFEKAEQAAKERWNQVKKLGL